ncbi:unnamed protein product [Heligmosomoides polygyrus]|uniref:CCHC-type domain-containing protein n=1 Tax=Heligmosomoides polygyrus TaxID=6339 RepID=A0A183F5M5_HELPZ|nr:unnamed protein product [Heligmosomoides polygyrus]
MAFSISSTLGTETALQATKEQDKVNIVRRTGVITSPTPLFSVVAISIPPIRSSSTIVFGTSATDQLLSVMPIPHHVELQEASVREKQFAAAVSAHATRMIRVLEAHQLLHALHCQRVPAKNTDKQYAIETLMSTPDAPTTSSRSRSEEEAMQPSLELKTSPSPPPGPSNTHATVAAPVLFAGAPTQQDNNMPIQPKPPTKRPCGGEQDRQPPAKAGRDWKTPWPSSQHRATTPPSGTTAPPGSPLPRPPPESSFVCAFCARPEHYTSDCPRHKRLSERVQLATDKQIYINSLKRHRGNCVRRDPCSRHTRNKADLLQENRGTDFQTPPGPNGGSSATTDDSQGGEGPPPDANAGVNITTDLPLGSTPQEASSYEEERGRRAEEADDSDNGSW